MKKNLIVSLFIFFFLIFSVQALADNIDDATEVYNEAIDLYKQNEVDKSIEYFYKATKLNPKFYEAYYNLAQILMSVNKDKEAFEALQKVVELKEKDWESLYNIGKIQYKRGYLSSSWGYLNKIASNAPQYESAKLLMTKIEKRQKELNLEAVLKEHKNTLDENGKTKGYNIEEVSAPSGVAVDSRGNIYIASFSENIIYKVSVIGQKTIFSKSSLLKGPIGLAFDKNDNLYVANYSANNIVKITNLGVASIFADIQKPYCLIFDSLHDRIYSTEQNTNKIVKFDL